MAIMTNVNYTRMVTKLEVVLNLLEYVREDPVVWEDDDTLRDIENMIKRVSLLMDYYDKLF